MTDIERLIAAGEALYGRTWQAQLSDLLEIDPRRIRQWVDGSRPISHGIWLEISAELRKRGKNALDLAKDLQM